MKKLKLASVLVLVSILVTASCFTNRSVATPPVASPPPPTPTTVHDNPGPTPPDTTPPVIGNISTSDISDTVGTIVWTPGKPTTLGWTPSDTVKITWTTDEPATGQVEYGPSITYGHTSSLEPGLATTRTVTLASDPGSIYHFRIRSGDAAGNEALSLDYTFGWCKMLADMIPVVTPYTELSQGALKLPQNWFGATDARSLIQWAERGFREHPPAEGRKRDALFMALDFAAMAGAANGFELVREYADRTTRSAYQQLLSAPAPDGVTVYKLYNEGTIVRAPGVCFGVDVILKSGSDDLAPGFAEILDALFITHGDVDHFDSALIKEMEKAGKPVIPARDDDSDPLGGLTDSGTVGRMQWTAFRGAHLKMGFSGFFLFRIGEYSIVHSGDNSRWIEFAASNYAKDIDVLLLKLDSVYGGSIRRGDQEAMGETLDAMKPRFVIPQHLLEVNFHGWRANSYDMGLRFYNQGQSGRIVQMLGWGEPFVIPRK